MLRTLIAGVALAALAPVAAQAGGGSKAASSDEFSAYDTDKSGQLDQSEFSSWYLTRKQQQLAETGQTASQAELSDQVTLAFAQADADKNQTVSQQELARFLSG